MKKKNYDQQDEASLEEMYKEGDHHSELFNMCKAIDDITVHWALPTYRCHCWVDVEQFAVCISKIKGGITLEVYLAGEEEGDPVHTVRLT